MRATLVLPGRALVRSPLRRRQPSGGGRQRDDWLQALPIYLPDDPAIPATGVPAKASFERPFQVDYEILQREATGGSGLLTGIAYALLISIAVLWLGTLAWGLVRLDRSAAAPA